MFTELAYSKEMQLILMVFSFIYNFILMYNIARIVLRVYGETASVRQKSLFAFLTGTVLQCAYVYIVYYIGGMVSFSEIKFLIVVTPNPITAMLYCVLGIAILKLSPLRSIELMGNAYLYFQIINSFTRLTGSIFFVQTEERFNYLLDITMYFTDLIIFMAVFAITWRMLNKNSDLIISKTHTFASPVKDFLALLLKACFIYGCMVLIPLGVPETVVANVLIFLILFLFFLATFTANMYQHTKADLCNKEAHLYSMIKSADEFRAVKHDFYNILQTYTGYLAIGDLEACKKYHASLTDITKQAGEFIDLSSRMGENPSLISLLIDKHTYAEKLGVHITTSLECSLQHFPMAEMDLCRVLSCLLDNAIEAASESEQKRAAFSIEQKSESSKLIIVTNSSPLPPDISQILIAGVTTKKGHQGIGLHTVRKIIDKNGNCTFQLSYYNSQMSAYIEMRQS